MHSSTRKWFLAVFLLFVLALAWAVWNRFQGPSEPSASGGANQAVPVEVAPVEHGPIELRRTFSGALESPAKFVVAPKVSGRVVELSVDLGDEVDRGQVVARLDNDEYVQAVLQAEADLSVARANLSEARSTLEIAERELQRIQTLKKRGVASESQLDTARSEQLAARAGLAVAQAGLAKSEALLETARIRLGYTSVSANWTGGNERRHVAERFVDAGDTVSANSPLISIVELHPLTGVIYVTEKDYARLDIGQAALLLTDAYPRERFAGRVARIAPVFTEDTRQARVELRIDNPDRRLKPGMFIRATVVLEREAEAVVVPAKALTERNDRLGLFVLEETSKSVAWRAVQTGIREDRRVQILTPPLSGRVVTLGQQMLEHGSRVSIPDLSEDRVSLSREPASE